MITRYAIIAVVLLLVLAQSGFMFAVQHGAASTFGAVWSGFDVRSSGYSQWVFDTIQWWWALPVTCLVLAGLSACRPKQRYGVLALAIGLVGTIALYGSVYAPWLLIGI